MRGRQFIPPPIEAGDFLPQNVKKPMHAGKFSLIKKEDVRQAVRSLVDGGILREVEKSNRYLTYYALTWSDQRKCDIFWNMSCPEPDNVQDPPYSRYTDMEWLDVIKSGPYGEEDAMEKLAILDHTALYCAEKDLFVKYFSTAPQPVLEYLKTAAQIETGVKKKICKQLWEAIEKTQ